MIGPHVHMGPIKKQDNDQSSWKLVAGKTENHLIKKLIMPSSIFTRCLLFKEISEFCLNPVWSIEISFRIAQIFLLLIKSDQRQIFYGFLYIVPIILFSVIYNIPKFLEVRHHRHRKGNTALVICTLGKQWKHRHRRNVMSYRFKSLFKLFSLVWLFLLFLWLFSLFWLFWLLGLFSLFWLL